MIYDYSGTKTFAASLEVDDPGNCAIMANGYYPVCKGVKFPGDYYMIVKTIAGKTTIIKWGAVTDLEELPSGYGLDVKTFNYKEQTIHKEITLFLNDGQKYIYDAKTVSEDEAFENLPKDYNYVATLERMD